MATYFTIDSGNFSDSATFGTAFTAGSANTIPGTGFTVPTTYSFAANVNSTGLSNIGVALQLSARSATPSGTISVILSGAEIGASREVTVSISALTPIDGGNNILQTTPMGWQYFAFDTALTVGVGKAMKVGIKTSHANQINVIGSTLVNLNRYIINPAATVPALTVDAVHITGKLSNSGGGVVNTVNYDKSATTIGTLYVHDRGVLSFDPNVATAITVAGTNGIQITPNGTFNVGISTSPVNVDCNINLTNTYINVHNGGILNAYGIQRSSYGYLSEDLAAGAVDRFVQIYQTGWRDNDSVMFTPNASIVGSFETVTTPFTIFDGRVWFSPLTFDHKGSTSIPGVINITRNIKFTGTSTGSFIRFLDGSISNLNYVEFSGFKNTTYKGLAFGTNSSGSVNLRGCVFKGDNATSMPAFSFVSTSFPSKPVTSNVSIRECNFYGFGGTTTNAITINAVSANNFTFTENVVLSASQNGMLINALSSTYANIKNNYFFNANQHGLYVTNPYILSGAIGGVGCMNTLHGSVVIGSNVRSNFDGLGGHYNGQQGVVISGIMTTLSTTIFSNISASNNTSCGVLLSGNANNLLSPIRMNINGLLANENGDIGLQGYAITGNLSSMSFDKNKNGNISISIGNANTIFDGITSTNSSYYVNSFGKAGTLAADPDAPLFFNDGSITSPATLASQCLSALDSSIVFTGDFTIETWMKTSVSAADTKARRIFSITSGSTNVASGLQLILGTADTTASKTLTVFTNTALIVGNIPVTDGEWHHIAISRVDGVMRLFVDGDVDGEEIDNTTVFDTGATSPLFLMRWGGIPVSGKFNGNISNFRILKKGIYTSNFTRPAGPFVIEVGTAFLLNGADYTNKTYKSLPDSNVEILSGRNYSKTLFKDSKLQGNLTYAIKLNNTKFEQFSMDSTTLSSNVEDIGSSSDIDFLQGSYNFNNCTFGTGILSSTIQNYQPEVFTENGFVVMKENRVANKHYKLLRAGKISLDALARSPNTISEKLEPTSTITKLRCGSKMVPVNKDASYTIGCYVYKSSGYSGAAPRLMLKHNSALGYVDTVLDTSVGADETWELLTGSVPAALDQGIFEVYVDCSGESGSGSVNIDNWILTLV